MIVVRLDTMQVDVEIRYVFASAVAGGLGPALALGLGGRDYVAANIDDWANQASDEVNTSDARPETRGSGTGSDVDVDD